MKVRNFLIILMLFMVLLCGVSAISAASDDTMDNVVSEIDLSDDSISVSNDDKAISGDDDSALNAQETDNVISGQTPEDIIEDSPTASSSTEDYTIYVGNNSTHDGLGTKEDPFATLELACNNYNAGEQKDTVNVMINDGTYYLGSYLKFNTNNLNIVGNGSVIIKNLYNDKQQSFGSNCNFSMSNIIFNGSDFNFEADYEKNAWFTPFIGDNGNIIFDNCTFADYNEIDESGIYNYILPNGADWNTFDYLYLFKNDNIVFNSCQFIGSRGMSVAYINYPCNLRFNYCNFGGKFSSFCGFGMLEDGATIVFDSCWLGHNNGYTNAFFAMDDYNPGYSGEIGFNYRADYLKDSLFVNRHAILEVSENYLGNNTYEIVGNLIWSDAKTNDNIDKLGSMTVYLSADNGNFSQQTVTLENGVFKVNYTSESYYHQITVLLDGQKIKLNNKINFTLND